MTQFLCFRNLFPWVEIGQVTLLILIKPVAKSGRLVVRLQDTVVCHVAVVFDLVFQLYEREAEAERALLVS